MPGGSLYLYRARPPSPTNNAPEYRRSMPRPRGPVNVLVEGGGTGRDGLGRTAVLGTEETLVSLHPVRTYQTPH